MVDQKLESLQRRIRMARGEEPGDLLLAGGSIVNTFSGEIYPANVLIGDGIIVGVGDYTEAKEIIDVSKQYLSPGFLDGHVHVESSMLAPRSFASAIVRRGTTTVIADPHEIANVLGTKGIEYLLEANDNPLVDIYVMLPSCVPATHMETSGAALDAKDLAPYIKHPRVLGLGEFMNFPAIAMGDESALRKILVAEGKIIDGHAPGVTGRELNGYITAGISSDHECITAAEALEKMRLGMKIMVREGSATKNLQGLLPFINQFNDQASFFATDDRHPNDLLDDGHIDQMIRRTIEYSGNIIRAIRMATINGCQHFGLTHLGQISPGKQADIVVIKDFHELKISHVIKKGKTVVFNGEVIAQAANKSNPELHHTVKLTDFSIDRLKIKATDGSHQLRVIGIVPEQIITEPFTETFHGENGEIRADLSRDLLKLAVIERHGKNGNIGLAFVKGLGITGAIAATVAHDSHNLIVAGSNDTQMARAVYLLEQSGGGLAIVTEKEEEVLPLPVAGLMSEDSLENVSAGISRLNDLAKNAGTTLTDPFMTLSFLALPVIPTLKLTDQGIVDVNQFRHVSLFCE